MEVTNMATSSIKKNFVVSGKKQVEMFANAIEASYQESLKRKEEEKNFSYRELKDPEDLKRFMERWKKNHAE